MQIAWVIDASPALTDDPDKSDWLDSARDLLTGQLGYSQVFESVNKSVNELYHDFKKM